MENELVCKKCSKPFPADWPACPHCGAHVRGLTSEAVASKNDLRLRLHNAGTAEWVRRARVKKGSNHDEMMRIAELCLEALDALDVPQVETGDGPTKVANLLRALDAKQAKIDSLMMEFCPGEMSSAQAEEWAKRQQPASVHETAENPLSRASAVYCSSGGGSAPTVTAVFESIDDAHALHEWALQTSRSTQKAAETSVLQQMRGALEVIGNARLTWAMSCDHTCAECDHFFDVIQSLEETGASAQKAGAGFTAGGPLTPDEIASGTDDPHSDLPVETA